VPPAKTNSIPIDFSALVGFFYDPPRLLGEFRRCAGAGEVPQPQRSLLNHHAHMTVTVEAHHRCAVDVHVERTRYGEVSGDAHGPKRSWYAREITLHRITDRRPVQYGIVRLYQDLLAPDVWEEIRSEQAPLGRVLIEHNVLREVQLCGLWQITAGKPLANLLWQTSGSLLYGRTALIYCDRQPAIELIEIVVP